MKKIWWILLCLLLTLTSFYLAMKYRNYSQSLYRIIPVKGIELINHVPSRDSLATLIIYISHRSGDKNMNESIYWNKLYAEFPKEELLIIGIVPENERISDLREKWNLKFPIGYDDDLRLARAALIAYTPFRILIHKNGKVYYMSPSLECSESQKQFYFEIIEILKRIKEKEYQKRWQW